MEEAVSTPTPVNARTVETGRATAWWQESWAMFMKNPGIWLVFGVIFCVIMGVLGMIPMLGIIAAALAQILTGGWMLAARKQDTGGTVEIGDLFLGFKDKLNALLVLGALAIAATVVIAVVMGILGAGALFGMGMSRSAGGLLASAGMGMVALLVGLVLLFVMAMAFWFAPALVVLRDAQPIDALKASWSASMANIVPFLVYGVIWLVAAIVASIPMGLGWFLLWPLTMLAMYRMYQDIFERQ